MYNSIYDKKFIRNRLYDLRNYIKHYYEKDFECLDLGCGNGRKIKKLASCVKKYVAIDSDPIRVAAGRDLCKNIKNIIFGVCDNFYLPFDDACFDLVSCFMSKCNFSEVRRVLKLGGYFVLETLGADDKRELKQNFGKDNLGWRGRLLNRENKEYQDFLKHQILDKFEIMNLFEVRYETTLLKRDLIDLLKMTHEIRNFGEKKDFDILESLCKNDYITFEEEKLIYICRAI